MPLAKRWSHHTGERQAAALGAVPVVGGALAAAASEWRLRKVEAGLAAIEAVLEDLAAERKEDLEEVLGWISTDRRREILAERALETAGSADDAEIRVAAARILHQGLIDDARIDDCRLYLTTLQRLSVPHLRLLGFMATRRLMNRPDDAFRDTTPSEVIGEWPEVVEVLPGLWHALQSEGAIARVIPSQIDTSVHETWQIPLKRTEIGRNNRERWRVTTYGRGLVSFVGPPATS